ncbi:MAG TPA: hypothetical protein VFG47_12815, partial [Geminicoccaceae bacterium]|nr:hypothetical protein [Geminicoccaceae bacterium]
EHLYRAVVEGSELLRELEEEARGRHRPQVTTGRLDGYARLRRMLGMAPYFEGLNREERLAGLVDVSEVAA